MASRKRQRAAIAALAVTGLATGATPAWAADAFDHPDTQANVITTDYSDWATNCPEYKVTAVQVSPSNGPSDWQKAYDAQARHSRRIAHVEAAE